uniref:Uncharacterized protein n=1 Tax=Cyanophora sudae TaxID=1522369 RepID=A0A873WYW2_9EUKA|nr:hypothetical protein DXZ12_mgp21 [Cyanophora sudae]QPB15060.1 hypothetical protein [Cyanophora sudae]
MNIIKKKIKSLRIQNKLLQTNYAIFYNMLDLVNNDKQIKQNKTIQMVTDIIMNDNYTTYNKLSKTNINKNKISINRTTATKYLFHKNNTLRDCFVGNIIFSRFRSETDLINYIINNNLALNIIIKYQNRYLYLNPTYKKLFENKKINSLQIEFISLSNINLFKWLFFYYNIYFQCFFSLKNKI